MPGSILLNASSLAARVVPEQTVLFLGAGASVASGGMTGQALAIELSQRLAKGDVVSRDLTEAATILQNRYGRKALIEQVIVLVRPLQPTGGMLALPEFPWHAIYTTNFDLVVERAYAAVRKPLVVVKSNYDWGRLEDEDGVPLFKIHGCVTADVVLGNRDRMVLTEDDYEIHAEYRESIFSRLQLDLLTKDVVIVGHSLSDPHIRREVDEAMKIRSAQSLPGKIYVLSYEEDVDRALILQNKGVVVAFGGLDAFADALGQRSAPVVAEADAEAAAEEFQLPLKLRSATISVTHELGREPGPRALYNGSPARYADIAAGLTIRRVAEEPLLARFLAKELNVVTLIGVAGVGKTTLARRLIAGLQERGYLAYEHNRDFPFRATEWVDVEEKLRGNGARAILLVDDCTAHLSQLNKLLDAIGQIDDPALSVIAVAERAQWLPRVKSRYFFANGHVETISDLPDDEINEFINLFERDERIRTMVEPSFATLSRREQFQRLRRRCGSDMFVCLKNVFASDAFDAILLREYADLDEGLQDIYRYVCGLEAVGTRIHRQLVLRILGVEAQVISGVLEVLQGLVDEYDIDPREGLYGWSTRHPVIARIITRYKFSTSEEHAALLEKIVEELNPAVPLELRTLRDLCNSEFGIDRLQNDEAKIRIYQRLIELAPAERIPRHRLIRSLLRLGELDAAEEAIRDAENVVRLDPPLARFKVRVLLRRAERTKGILDEDRIAMLRQAVDVAEGNARRFPDDMHAYTMIAEVAAQLAERLKNPDVLTEAIQRLEHAADRLLDPALTRALEEYRGRERRLKATLKKSPAT